ncbi:MAG: DUF421 domain-containing protein [Candidatus Eremiobacteraeota bacterium]|nr:DUF421 domain-containing protein [Candidatus Eremiobacteraeota bacterium]MBC5804561.1 DUF421 domain-containing protein [Candidatus Eremiobacteraeota bacterium]MBC5821961.1 DUF421 domain-containing protein [Candidatus Eremiobacteraeota bacterium]
MLFNSWAAVEHTAVVALIGYVALVAFVRISGNRTLSHMNAFDFIISVTLGSMLARALLAQNNSIVQLVVGFIVLLGAQALVAKAGARSLRFHYLVTPKPKRVYAAGGFNLVVMRRQGIGEPEIRAAVRAVGLRDLKDVDSVVLETQGQLSVVWRGNEGDEPSMKGVTG